MVAWLADCGPDRPSVNLSLQPVTCDPIANLSTEPSTLPVPTPGRLPAGCFIRSTAIFSVINFDHDSESGLGQAC
ncbi:unnamed protein product [Gadus morhua 'NCC']